MPLLLPEIKDIKKFIEFETKRKRWSYKKLAENAKIDRSTLSKVLSGKVSPTYETLLKLITILNQEEGSITAKHLMIPQKTIVSVNSDDSLIEAMEKMFKGDYVRLFVKNGNKIVGIIDETSVLSAIKNQDNLFRTKVKKYLKILNMPIVNSTDSLNKVIEKLSNNRYVLVMDKNRILGLITPYDIFRQYVLIR